MDKTILSAGLALVALGLGFLMVPYFDASLSIAYTSGGYLWLILGGITVGFALRVKREVSKPMGAIR